MKYYLAILLALVSLGAKAGVHKWVDSHGRVHYSDSAPPTGVQSQTLQEPESPAGGGGNQTGSGNYPVLHTPASERAALEAKVKAMQQMACQAAQAKLDQLNSLPQQQQNSEAIQMQKDQAQDVIQRDCE